jgi:hypothetical protein
MDYLNYVAENEFVLFNLPDKITKEKVIELCSVKGVDVISASITKSLNHNNRVALAIVKLANPS